jgi:prolyl-tRNA synthetase
MRGREFLMKDAYSFDLDEAGARNSYYTQLLAYLRTFQRLGIRAVPMKADSGPIGGDLSHEFIVLAPTGESEVFYDAAFEEFDWSQSDLVYDDAVGLEALFERISSTYAATDETHDESRWGELAEDRRRQGRGIEVGHIFYFGDKYSASMGLKVSGSDGQPLTPMMGAMALASRLVGAIIERATTTPGSSGPKRSRRWSASSRCAATTRQHRRSRRSLRQADRGGRQTHDDRDERGGAKLAGMDLIGLPSQVIIGPRGLANGVVELKDRRTGLKVEVDCRRAGETTS